jgi:hypothetical protein
MTCKFINFFGLGIAPVQAVASAYAAAGCGYASASGSAEAEIVTELETIIGKGCRYGNDGVYDL